jgi:hypothetical protein
MTAPADSRLNPRAAVVSERIRQVAVRASSTPTPVSPWPPATLIVYAAVTYQAGRPLHGRYLIGFHLGWIPIAWCVAGLLRLEPLDRSRLGSVFPRPMVVLTAVAALHGYTLTFILARYF